MKVVLNHCLIISCLLINQVLRAQEGVGIGTNDPHQSAVLEVKSESGTKGMLIPRIPNRGNVVNPTTGLIIYHEASNAFEYYDGSGWVQLIPTPAKFDIDMDFNKITDLSPGSDPSDAVNKSQLDGVDASNLNRSGNEAMTGNLNMGNRRVTNMANATANNDAVTLGDLETRVSDFQNTIDTRFGGLSIKLIEIGRWNMDVTQRKQTTLTGLGGKVIVAIFVSILPDPEVSSRTLPHATIHEVVNNTQATLSWANNLDFSYTWGAGTVGMNRETNGVFDSQFYNDPLTNRGYLTVFYID